MPAKLKPEREELVRKNIIVAIRMDGEFKGYKKKIIKTNNTQKPYAIIHQCDLFGQSSELYENLDEATHDFIELMKTYG